MGLIITRRAAVAYFFNFMVETPWNRACAQQVKIAWISTYPTVQIRRTTFVGQYSNGADNQIIELDMPLVGKVPMQGLTIKLSDTPGSIHRPLT